MGALYAALLRKSGHEVWAIDPWREHVDAIASDGLRVSGASGSYVVDGF
jgi:2-dehydropantoate 2-reductase